ncbi:MAG: acyl-CoA dehydrogenase family protein [candidate division WOR-3 bacterium]
MSDSKIFELKNFFDLDDYLREEEKLIRNTVRDFVEKEILPHIGEWWLKGEFPKHLIPQMAELGLFGPTIPEEYGGAGLGYVAYGLMMQELEYGDSGIRSFCSVQSSLAMYSIFTFGSEEQKKKYLPLMAKGKLIGSFGLTEPNAGSDPASMETRCRKEGNTWIINGRKMWITNGTMCDLSIIWAKDENEKVQGFIVEKGTKGFTSREIKTKISLRASDTSELILDEVRIPESQRLPNTEGLKSALMPLNEARYGITWGCVGAAWACFEESYKHALVREQFKKPIASFQITQKKLVDMFEKIWKAQLLCLHLGRMKEKGKARYIHVSLVKRNNTRVALEVAREARTILGAYGITTEYNSLRHANNMESVHTYEGTYEIHTLIVGRYLTDIDAIDR